MGPLRVLAFVASLAGCETSGIQVDVILPEGSTAPDHVRLFVGVPTEDDAATIGPEKFGVTRAGSRWVRDPMDYDDVLEVTPGAELSFGFLSEVDHAELGAVIAVGYTGSRPTSAGSLFHLKAGVGVVRVFKLKMFPAVDPRDKKNWTRDVQVEVWGPEDGDEACVHLWNKHPDRDLSDPHDSAFIVSPHDRDCDGFDDQDPVLECVPEVHDATIAPRLEELACAISTATVDGKITECRLGGPQCQDGGKRASDECGPSKYCAPLPVCATCAPLPPAGAAACVRDPLRPIASGQETALHCVIATQRDPDNTSNAVMCSPMAFIPLPVPPLMPALACTDAKITTTGQGFDGHADAGNIRFDVSPKQGCELELKVSGYTPTAAISSGEVITGMIAVDTDNGKGLALPFVFSFNFPQTTCGESRCDLVGDYEPVRACLDTKPTPP